MTARAPMALRAGNVGSTRIQEPLMLMMARHDGNAKRGRERANVPNRSSSLVDEYRTPMKNDNAASATLRAHGNQFAFWH